jgi:hypothetical protein
LRLPVIKESLLLFKSTLPYHLHNGSTASSSLSQFTLVHVGSEVPMAMVMSSIFWNMTSCRPLKFTDVSEERVASIFRAEE